MNKLFGWSSLAESKMGKKIWKDSENKIYLRYFNNEIKTSDKILVMVRYDSNDSFSLTEHIISQKKSEDGDAFVLYELISRDELDLLAIQLHGDEGFQCGRLQVLNLNITVQDFLPPVPPEFVETIMLKKVNDLIIRPDEANIRENIVILENLGTRFHSTIVGLSVPAIVKSLFEDAGSGISNFSVVEVSHTGSAQNSVIATIQGSDPTLPIIIVGAHIDSINGFKTNPDQSEAPGADDDASGIATIIETIKSISAENGQFKRTIEFHGYAAEEVGLIGSSEIAKSYQDRGIKVAAMFQLDMNAYTDPKDPNKDTIFLPVQDTTLTLRRSVKELLRTYLNGGYQEGQLKAGTSDHRSWAVLGYNTVFPFENPEEFNDKLHTAEDTIENINNLSLSMRFTKLVLTFVAHHAGLTSAAAEYQLLVSQANQNNLPKDLNVAVTTDLIDDSKYNIVVASDTLIERVELCKTTTADSVSCDEKLSNLVPASQTSTRKIYATFSALTLVSGEHYRIFGYDLSDTLQAFRKIRLER